MSNLLEQYWMKKEISEQVLMSWLSGLTLRERNTLIGKLRFAGYDEQAQEIEEDFE